MTSLWTDGILCNRMCMLWPNIDTIGKLAVLTATGQVHTLGPMELTYTNNSVHLDLETPLDVI